VLVVTAMAMSTSAEVLKALNKKQVIAIVIRNFNAAANSLNIHLAQGVIQRRQK